MNNRIKRILKFALFFIVFFFNFLGGLFWMFDEKMRFPEGISALIVGMAFGRLVWDEYKTLKAG